MATLIKGKNLDKPYTIRYQNNGRQREKSFRTYKEANDFKIKTEHDLREGTFVDPKHSRLRFEDAASAWLARRQVSPSTRTKYDGLLRNHIYPKMGHRTLGQVAQDRDTLADWLLDELPAAKIGPSIVGTIYIVITSVVSDAVESGKLPRARVRITGIELPDLPSARADDFVFPEHAELAAMVETMPAELRLSVWLMRGCGLRIGEALAVKPGALTDGTLRISDQLLAADTYGPLKHRKPGDFRDVPAPHYVTDAMTQHVPYSPERLFKPMHRYTYTRIFNRARDAAGIATGFTPHSLRHVFASVCLANGVPITDVAEWLGHRNIQITYGIYGHLVPSAVGKARGVLDSEYESWSQ
jgi:integrase